VCLPVQTTQHFNRRFFLHKMRSNHDKGVEILHQKYYDIIEGPQKHFDTMAKYISDDVFVSMTASRSSHFSWISTRLCVAFLTAYQLSHLPVILFWSGSLRQFRTILPFSRVRLLNLEQIFNRADRPLLGRISFYKYVLYTSSLTLRNKFNETFFLCTWTACLSTNWWQETSTKRTKSQV